MLARVEHIEASERDRVTTAEGTIVSASFTVTATVEVRGVSSMGEAVRLIEQRITRRDLP